MKQDEIQAIIRRNIINVGDDSLSSDDSTNEATDNHDDDRSDENDKEAKLD